MKIICCGCSYMATSPKLPGTHFTEILSTQHQLVVQNYSKSGASNFTIRLQIEQAIRENADLLLIAFTSENRVEIPIQNKQYDLLHGIKNIQYLKRSPEFYDSSLVTTQSDVIGNHPQTDAVVKWFSDIYDSKLKLESDYYIASGALDKLTRLGIPFLFTDGGLRGYSMWDPDLSSIIDWTPWKQYQVDDSLNPWNSPYQKPNTYHTTVEEQSRLAQCWAEKIRNTHDRIWP